ncbi:hypothetical protein PTKIN_Ptkin11bG0087100 [Pterospermum kingtungense]
MKVNFDGALDKDSRIGGIGIIIRDSAGLVMAAKAVNVHDVADSFTIKAIAVIQAMKFASTQGFRHVILEGDASSIIKSLNRADSDLSPIGCLIDEGRILTSCFHSCIVSHVSRQGNEVAHSLARYGLSV